MHQYLDTLVLIKKKGTYKPAAREGMPGTLSYFGHQCRYDLNKGFPLLTTKKMFFKGVVVELIWFLRGDTNIKYLIDNGVNIWNEDAFNYYCKKCKEHNSEQKFTFESFVEWLKGDNVSVGWSGDSYKLGDCGYQYGRVWRNWPTEFDVENQDGSDRKPLFVDQINGLIHSLKNSPESRRHLVTAIDPAHDTDLALYWCHALFQFNCRPLTVEQREDYMADLGYGYPSTKGRDEAFSHYNIPKYYLDCQLYQRSADVFLGVPFNIASYALLTEILAKICNMVPGDFIHSFGDVHIYDNHKDAVEEQLKRMPDALPKLDIKLHFKDFEVKQFDYWLPSDFELKNYNPQDKIKAELSTGLKK